MEPRRRVAAIILAAGRSARMGEAKQLLPLGGGTVLERTLEQVRHSAAETPVLVLGHAAAEIREALSAAALDGVTTIVNEEFGDGMSSSLRAGLAALDPSVSAALIVLGDQPLVQAATMDRIIRKYQESVAEIVVPHYEGRHGNPVVLGRSVFAEAMALEGDTGFRALFGRHAAGLAVLDVDDEGVVLDIDIPEDYERLRERVD